MDRFHEFELKLCLRGLTHCTFGGALYSHQLHVVHAISTIATILRHGSRCIRLSKQLCRYSSQYITRTATVCCILARQRESPKKAAKPSNSSVSKFVLRKKKQLTRRGDGVGGFGSFCTSPVKPGLFALDLFHWHQVARLPTCTIIPHDDFNRITYHRRTSWLFVGSGS